MQTKSQTSLRERFAGGEALTGIIDFIGAPMVIEILARAGIHFVIIDMEHCPMDMDRLAHLVRAAGAAGTGRHASRACSTCASNTNGNSAMKARW